MKRSLDEKIFNVVLLVLLAIFVVMSFSYNPTARGFPLFFGVVGFVMIMLQLISYMAASPPQFFKQLMQKGSSAGGNEIGDEESLPWGTYFKLIACLIGYAVLIQFFDYLVATLIFLFLFMRFAGDVKWITTIIYSVVFTGTLYFLFEYLIKP